MDRRAEAARQLQEYRLLTAACRNLEQRLPLLKKGSADFEQCDRALERSCRKVLAIEQAVAALEPVLERVLWYMYLDGQSRSVAQVCEKLGLSQSSLYRRRIKALDKFALAYFGMQDPDC